MGPTLVSNGEVGFSLVTQSLLGESCRLLCITPRACLSACGNLLSPKKVSLTDLQRLSGKCMSLSLAVAGARLYTNEINTAVSRASKSSRAHPTLIIEPLRQEIEHWLFLKSWSGLLPWRSGIHNQFVLHTDVFFRLGLGL